MTLKEKIARSRKLDKLTFELASYTKGSTMKEPFGEYNRGKAASLVKLIDEFKEEAT